MPFIPHTPSDVQTMLDAIGVANINALFDEIPNDIPAADLSQIPEGLSELAITQLARARAKQDGEWLNFIGAGAYEHHIPAAVWELVRRGEFYSAYTPYQAEASQGTLQMIFEFQSFICGLTGLEVANASVYDGATALAEACLMAIRATQKNQIILPRNIHPFYREVVRNILGEQNIEILEINFDLKNGLSILPEKNPENLAALVVPQTTFFGNLEDFHAMTDWAHAHGALVIALSNPLLLTIFTPPAEWGARGADIAVGEGQVLGLPLASGGPYYGYMACTKALMRQMPGRIVGRTTDLDGKTGFTLTLQAREQHIRRAKATSNICTNQGLMVTASTIHIAIMGNAGLQSAARQSCANLDYFCELIRQKTNFVVKFNRFCGYETVLESKSSAKIILEKLLKQNILAGLALEDFYPELPNTLLIAITETKSQADIERLVDALAAADE